MAKISVSQILWGCVIAVLTDGSAVYAQDRTAPRPLTTKPLHQYTDKEIYEAFNNPPVNPKVPPASPQNTNTQCATKAGTCTNDCRDAIAQAGNPFDPGRKLPRGNPKTGFEESDKRAKNSKIHEDTQSTAEWLLSQCIGGCRAFYNLCLGNPGRSNSK